MTPWKEQYYGSNYTLRPEAASSPCFSTEPDRSCQGNGKFHSPSGKLKLWKKHYFIWYIIFHIISHCFCVLCTTNATATKPYADLCSTMTRHTLGSGLCAVWNALTLATRYFSCKPLLYCGAAENTATVHAHNKLQGCSAAKNNNKKQKPEP